MADDLKKILYAEDEPDIRAVAQLSLEAVGGFEVELCDSGEAALAAVGTFNPDLILLDVMMPGMDGPTTLLKLREIPQFAITPVAFFTAKAMPSEVERFKGMGALGVISKPFDPMDLPNQVNAIWDLRQK